VDKPINRTVLFYMSVVFFLTTLSFAYHHHNLSLQFSTCSICKAKSSLSPSVKTTIDALVPTVIAGSPGTFPLDATAFACADGRNILRIRDAHPGSNKAPPRIQS
jgi:hypothetical protein